MSENQESSLRSLTPALGKLVGLVAFLFSAFNVVALFVLSLGPWIHLSICLGFSFVLMLLTYKGPLDAFGGVLAAAGVAADLLLGSALLASLWYYANNYVELIMRLSAFPTGLDIFFSAVLVFGSLEVSRRACGAALSLVGSAFLIYAFFGHLLPPSVGHPGFNPSRVVTYLYSDTGIFGSPLAVSATYVFLFVLFGEFLSRFGGGDVFIQLATGLAGHRRGGPAKVAVFASALFGTIAGSSIANVAATGAFTIPLMKRIGYRPEFAGAVEAAASTGGQIMPPVMGATAFILAEIVGVSYGTLAVAAAIPAVLYFFAVLVMVHCEAVRSDLRGLPKSELPNVRKLLWEKWPFLLPIVVVFLALLVFKVSTSRAALMGIAAACLVPFAAKGVKIDLRAFAAAMSSGAVGTLGIISSCTVAGVIIGCLALTGLGLKIGNFIVSLAGNSTILMLIAAMILSIVLGMGLPSAAAYIIASSVVGPALVIAGIPQLTAHLFIFYFAILAMITPPVALTSYTAAGIAGANATRVGVEGFKMTFAGFIVPYMFVYSPALLMQGNLPTIALAVVTAMIGVTFLGCAVQRYFFGSLNILQSLTFFAAACLTIHSGIATDAAGIGIAGAVVLLSPKLRANFLAYLREGTRRFSREAG